ncbi:3D domain-containing protein [Clostridioides difficile]|uniref:3D domain-containing protein n=1 Tax=Clostridioides difficile TaxID=1496 RepID=UPI000D1ED9D1|nr:3D domain-containing protein [Clostridioides difficile]HBE9444565.1 3D domain-containing protein [Clostridioides difficile]
MLFLKKLSKHKKIYINIGVLTIVTLFSTFIQSPLSFGSDDVPSKKQKEKIVKESIENDFTTRRYTLGQRKIRDDVKNKSTLNDVKLPLIKVEILEEPNYILNDRYITNISEIPASTDGIQTKSIGKFKVSAFCNCKKCKVNSESMVKYRNYEGVNVAVDPNIISFGTKIYIEGLGIRQAQPNSQKVYGKEIKVYVKTHNEVVKFGAKTIDVYKVF